MRQLQNASVQSRNIQTSKRYYKEYLFLIGRGVTLKFFSWQMSMKALVSAPKSLDSNWWDRNLGDNLARRSKSCTKFSFFGNSRLKKKWHSYFIWKSCGKKNRGQNFHGILWLVLGDQYEGDKCIWEMKAIINKGSITSEN